MRISQLKTLNLTDNLPIEGSIGNQPDTIFAKQLTSELMELSVTDENGKCLGVTRNQKIYTRDENFLFPTPLEYFEKYGPNTIVQELVSIDVFDKDMYFMGNNIFKGQPSGTVTVVTKIGDVKPELARDTYIIEQWFQCGCTVEAYRNAVEWDLANWQGTLNTSRLTYYVWETYTKAFLDSNFIILNQSKLRLYNDVLLSGEFEFSEDSMVGGKARFRHLNPTIPSFLKQSNVNILVGNYDTTKENIIYIDCVKSGGSKTTGIFDVRIYQNSTTGTPFD